MERYGSVLIALISAVISGLGVTILQGHNDTNTKTLDGQNAIDLQQQKAQTELVINAVKDKSAEVAANNLRLLLDAGLIKSLDSAKLYSVEQKIRNNRLSFYSTQLDSLEKERKRLNNETTTLGTKEKLLKVNLKKAESERKKLDAELKKQQDEIARQKKELASLKAEKDTAFKYLSMADERLKKTTKSNEELLNELPQEGKLKYNSEIMQQQQMQQNNSWQKWDKYQQYQQQQQQQRQ
ncbi:MAG: hypothetical protein AB7G44_07270 [Bacteroidia bacterium]